MRDIYEKNYWITASASLLSTIWFSFFKFISLTMPFFYERNQEGELVLSSYSMFITFVVLFYFVISFIYAGISNHKEVNDLKDIKKKYRDLDDDYCELELANYNKEKLLNSIR